jgi:hypothetical protein
MHPEWHERKAQKLREEAAKELEKRAGCETKAAKAEEQACKAEEAAAKTSSESTRRSKLSDARRKRDDSRRALMKAAQHTKRAGDATRKAAQEERAAASARKTDQKAEQRRFEQQRKKEARERDRAERAERRRQHDEVARVDALERRTRDVETALAAARLAAPAKVTILFLAGNPRSHRGSDLRLDREVWEIRDNLLRTEFRDVIHFEVHPAARLSDVTEALNRYKPDVVHFSGHGSDDVLVFDDPRGDPQPVDFSHFGMLLQAAAKPIRLALFNACNSSDQAEMACDFIDAAIGMETSIDDEDAKAFAGAFYNSLGYANPVETAFQQAVAHVTATRGHLSGAPQLYVKHEIRADEMVIVAPRQT